MFGLLQASVTLATTIAEHVIGGPELDFPLRLERLVSDWAVVVRADREQEI